MEIEDTGEVDNHQCKEDKSILYKCGECSAESRTVCLLLQHLRTHVTTTQRYLLDDLVKVGFVRHETVDKAIQTDILDNHKNVTLAEFSNETSKTKSQMTDDEKKSNSMSLINETHQIQTSTICAKRNNEKVVGNKLLNVRERISAKKPRTRIRTENIILQDNRSFGVSDVNGYSLSMTVESGNEENKTYQCKVSKTWIPETVVQNWEQIKLQNTPKLPLSATNQSNEFQDDNTDDLNNASRDTCKSSSTQEFCRDTNHISVEGQVEMKNKSKMVVCHLCGRTFSNNKALHGHVTEQHQSPESMKTCEQCGKKFPTNSKLKQHLVVHHKERIFSCKVCDKTFPRQNTLNSHMRYFHGNSSHRIFKCPKCTKIFIYPSSYKQHLQAHEPGFKCEICNMVFSRSSSLKRHEQRHTGIKPHSCNICGHRFIQKTAYWIHMEKHHDLTKSKVLEQEIQKNQTEGQDTPF